MRKLSLLLTLLFTIGITGSAFATHDCTGSHYLAAYPGFYEYTHNDLTSSDTTCWSIASTLTTTSMSYCYGSPTGWQFNTWYGQSATHSFTVGANDPGSSTWSAQLQVDFDDPNDNWYDQIVADVIVTHNGVNTTYNIYSATGSSGAATYCATPYTTFTAVNGDTITIRITGARAYSNAIVKFRNVRIYRNA